MAIDYGPPNPPFQGELDQVAIDAAHAGTVLAEANVLPDDFPAETLSELCRALAGLKDGTGRNAGVQLEIARAMLPRIRREHFFPEDQIDPSDEDDIRLVRGMSLDQSIGSLITSVTTALDEFRHQLQIEHDDRVGVEEEGLLAEGESIASLNSASSEIIENAADLEKGFKEHGIGETPNGDILRRRIKDGANLAGTARAQLLMRPIVKRWLRASAEALRATPQLIQKAAKAIKIGIDVAEPFGEWWLETKRDVLAGLAKTVKGFADALEEAGKRLARHTEPGQAQAQRQRDPEVVAAEAQVRQMLLDGRRPPAGLAALVQVMDLRGKPSAENRIARPEDLALLENLEDLRTNSTNLTIDQVVGPLSKLSRLRNLQINGGRNLHQVGKLTGLTSLAVLANQATDISALGKLTGLTSLSVLANQATDISALGKLTGLTNLSVLANQATDISALGKLTGLTGLTVHTSQAADISALGKLTGLTSLTVYTSQATDISALGKLTGLTSLAIQNARLELDKIGNLPNLRVLKIDSKSFTGLPDMGRFPELREIVIASAANPVDLSPLEACKKLERVRLYTVNVTNYGKVRNLVV